MKEFEINLKLIDEDGFTKYATARTAAEGDLKNYVETFINGFKYCLKQLGIEVEDDSNNRNIESKRS